MAGPPRIQFQTKVLIPTVLVMALLQSILMWVVNQRFRHQFSASTSQNLNTARSLFENSERIRTHDKLLQYKTVANDTRVKSLCTLAGQNEDAVMRRTFKALLQDDLMKELNADIAAYTTSKGALFAIGVRDPRLQVDTSTNAISRSIQKAFLGEPNVDTVRVGNRLFDITSIPVVVSDEVAGVLTFGDELGDGVALETKNLTGAEIVFISGDSVAASTINDPALFPEFVKAYNSNAASESISSERIIHGEHFRLIARPFASLHADLTSGYLLLSSYEKPLQELYDTQRMLFAVGIFAILSGSVIVWLIVRKLTRPLRDLRDGAEAVGRGDFQRQVSVSSNDECGELAEKFNQMTANLRKSHADLEKSVDSLRTTQAQLIQREKLSAIGEFVAGVTHELNNPLTVVIGLSELLRDIDQDPKHRKHLDTIVSGAQRCHKIVRSLLSFARQQTSERKLVNVNDLIEATLTFMQYEMRTSNIEVKREMASDLPPISADPHQLQQVFLNILNNARQAMEIRNHGALYVSTAKVGKQVRIILADDGPGIAPENLSKIFTPFFTTKEVGKGTGLGLSVSYGIIQEHGGSIQLASELGKGTSFTIDLPLAEAPAEKNGAPPPGKASQTTISGTGKRILAIDDEETILELIRDTLTPLGYSVDIALDGARGLSHLALTSYDLILSDWKMPGMNGQQIYERLLSLNPAAAGKMVFMTGDVVNEHTRKFFAEHKSICMAKPFSMEEFKTLVGKMTSKQPSSAE